LEKLALLQKEDKPANTKKMVKSPLRISAISPNEANGHFKKRNGKAVIRPEQLIPFDGRDLSQNASNGA